MVFDKFSVRDFSWLFMVTKYFVYCIIFHSLTFFFFKRFATYGCRHPCFYYRRRKKLSDIKMDMVNNLNSEEFVVKFSNIIEHTTKVRNSEIFYK